MIDVKNQNPVISSLGILRSLVCLVVVGNSRHLKVFPTDFNPFVVLDCPTKED